MAGRWERRECAASSEDMRRALLLYDGGRVRRARTVCLPAATAPLAAAGRDEQQQAAARCSLLARLQRQPSAAPSTQER